MHDQFTDFPDISGMTFGRLTVLSFSHQGSQYRRYWHCRCVCGAERLLREDYIKGGVATCAVCRRQEIAARTGPRHCPRCEQQLPRESFSRDRTTTDGLRRYCKSCTRSIAAEVRTRAKRRRPEDILTPSEKRCAECGITKPASEYWTDRAQRDGLARTCATCKNLNHRSWYSQRGGRERRLGHARTARYGMVPEDLDQLLHSQDGRCPICTRPFSGPRSYVIDHDHETGVVRALLCLPCNNGLGAFGDDPKRLAAAIEYLGIHRAGALSA